MLGKPYFRLAHDLEAADSFATVAGLLSRDLTPLIDAAATVVIETDGDHRIRAVHGGCEIARRLRERLDEVNRLLADHPLIGRIDLSDPGELGVTASDFMKPEEHRECELNKLIHAGRAADDAMVGKLVVRANHTTVLITCRWEGVFTPEQRERFDAVLFTARAVLGRIGSMGVESAIRKFLTRAADSPVAVFAVRPNSEVLPLSQQAVRLSEHWWSEDEALRILDADAHASLRESVRDAWTDPVSAEFQPATLDLGGGAVKCHALPKADGEIFLFVPVTGQLPSGDEALKAVLTRRQREIMEWIAEGKTSAEAAIILGISPRTVEKHLEAIFQRLGVENRVSAVRRFLDLKSGDGS